MKRIICFLSLILMVTAYIHSELLVKIYEPFKMPSIHVDDKQLYVVDSGLNIIHIYSLKDYKKVRSFGNKGEGPGEFFGSSNIQIFKDYLFGESRGKVMYFTKSGDLIKEVRVSPDYGLLYPIGKKVAGIAIQKSTDQLSIKSITSRFVELKICLFTPGEGYIKEFYTFNKWFGMSGPDSPKQDQYLFKSAASIKSNGDHLFVGDPIKGFYFLVINKRGEVVRKIDIEFKMKKVTESEKKQKLESLRESYGEELWARTISRVKYIFPEYYPPYQSFQIDDQTIYARTHRVRNNKRDWHVVDLKRYIIKFNLRLPNNRQCSFHTGKMYYLVEKEEHSELHVIDVLKNET